jgi:GT2 family glycosyltransferase
MISYVIPTRDRPRRLKDTLLAIEALGDHRALGGAEVIIADNDSAERLVLPKRLAGSIAVRELRLPANIGAAARNEAAKVSDPASEWLVMLDDDSHPLDLGFAASLAAQPADVAALAADIHLASGVRESGGLPEVFIGCGVAVRRGVFLALGGYDPAFGYYAEEYDLAARMLLAGRRVVFDPAFRVLHAKDTANRSFDLIAARLVRNNGWVAQRYAPEGRRLPELRALRRRYRTIAAKEHALRGFGRGLAELRATLRRQPRTPMSEELWDRFTGAAAARRTLLAAYAARPFATAAIVDEGKNVGVIVAALDSMGVRLTGEGEDAEVAVIGTMSPGPMLDAFERRVKHRYPGAPRVIMPWSVAAPMPPVACKREPRRPPRAAA